MDHISAINELNKTYIFDYNIYEGKLVMVINQ